MEIVTKELPPDHRIVLAGDLHIGSKNCHLDAIHEMVDFVGRSPKTYLVLMGDQIEAIMVDDRRFVLEQMDPEKETPIAQYQYLIEMLRPIKRKIITILLGNHEWKLHKYGDFTRHEVCKALEVPYGTFSSIIQVMDKNRRQYEIFATHGRKGIRSTATDVIRRKSNEAHQLKDRLKHKYGKAIVMARGHTHKLIVQDPSTNLYLTTERGKIKQKYTLDLDDDKYIHPDHRYYCSTGGFLRLYGQLGTSGYAELFDYDPVELGYVVIHAHKGKVERCEEVIV